MHQCRGMQWICRSFHLSVSVHLPVSSRLTLLIDISFWTMPLKPKKISTCAIEKI